MTILKRDELTAVLVGITVTEKETGGESSVDLAGMAESERAPFRFAAAYVTFLDAVDDNVLHMCDSTVDVSFDDENGQATVSYDCDEYGDSDPDGKRHIDAVFDVTVTATGERAPGDKLRALIGITRQDTPFMCRNCKWELCYDNGDGTFECLGCHATLTAAQIGLETNQ